MVRALPPELDCRHALGQGLGNRARFRIFCRAASARHVVRTKRERDAVGRADDLGTRRISVDPRAARPGQVDAVGGDGQPAAHHHVFAVAPALDDFVTPAVAVFFSTAKTIPLGPTISEI